MNASGIASGEGSQPTIDGGVDNIGGADFLNPAKKNSPALPLKNFRKK